MFTGAHSCRYMQCVTSITACAGPAPARGVGAAAAFSYNLDMARRTAQSLRKLPRHCLESTAMKLKTLATSILLAFAAGGAMADDQTVSFAGSIASFDSMGTVLAGGNDVITFDNLVPGIYDFTMTLSGQYLTLTGVSLNGIEGLYGTMGKWTFAGVDGTSTTPLVLTLSGITSTKGTPIYSGELSVAAVPEPETYAMFLAGLGALGFMARRRRMQA